MTNDHGRRAIYVADDVAGQPGDAYRYMATVTINGVSAPLKFQSACFGCVTFQVARLIGAAARETRGGVFS